MKTRIVLAVVLLFVLGYRLNSPRVGTLALAERSFSFGPIADTGKVTHIFSIRNSGDAKLVISNVRTSCGCTAAIIDHKELEAGDSAHIKVTFDPVGKGAGEISKTIWIESNAGKGTDSIMMHATIQNIHPAELAMTAKNIFTGDCRSCHVDKGIGKTGFDLFNADCVMCHETSPKSHAPNLGKLLALKVPSDSLHRIITAGRPEKNMPAFAMAHGGPLSSEQIASLVKLLQEGPPMKR
jgi:mono/diheme cytochrome c family protein